MCSTSNINLVPSLGNSSGFSMKCFESPRENQTTTGFAYSLTKSCGTAGTVNLHGGAGLRRRRPALQTAKWEKFHLHYEFMAGFPEEGKVAVENAIGEWDRWSRFSFSERSPGDTNPADIKIGIHRGSHGDGYPFDGGEVLAHAFYPTDGRLHFDGDQLWSHLRCPSGGGGKFFDLESVALHELGHVLGLRHSAHRGDVMFPEISPGEIKRRLTINDVEGMRCLYS